MVCGGDEDPRAVRGPGQFRGQCSSPGSTSRVSAGPSAGRVPPARRPRPAVPAPPEPRPAVPGPPCARWPDGSFRAVPGWPRAACRPVRPAATVKSNPGTDSRVRRSPELVSMTTRSLRSPPAPSLTDHPVTARRPSGLRSKAFSSRARPAWGVRSRRAAASPAALPPGPLDPLQPAWAAQVGDQQPLLVRAEVMVPVPDQGRLVQDGRHARVGPGPALRPVASGPAGARQHRRGERGQLRTGGGGEPAGAARRRRDAAGLPACGRQQPQGPLPAGVVAGVRGRRRTRPGGAGRGDRNSIPPSGRKAGLSSPSADQVSRAGVRAGPAAPVSTRQMLDLNVRPSGARADTVTASQVPSGDSRRPVSRGRAR